ncbi:hypothetical protein A2Z33_05100 [Candidatus Gottesmanbacteria bacterium RBG_16_52_11]|uniref:Haloacid dehalogenase n=1 Tax=Candidatus Gottesmanbacteria bacterium RBG_16_52_11 TaxID=1798374 RepID=A0A1F5YQE9_9BACT|nr:MAG: hypothetical protein A2Z33_05100 [Candidatus Gottesmanbacteria bacterium RBG_16_52_11]
MGVTSDIYPEFMNIWNSHHSEINTIYDVELMINEFREIGLNLPDDYCFNDEFVKRFTPNESITKPINKAIEYGISVGLLTNMYQRMFKKISDANLLPRINFYPIIDSSLLGVAKPDIKIYEIALKEISYKPQNVLFVDNSIPNIKTAQLLGWQTYLYNPRNPIKSSNELLDIINISR